jgi:uncharacterized protein YdeI (YjbR/CyaY-like superfamily)
LSIDPRINTNSGEFHELLIKILNEQLNKSFYALTAAKQREYIGCMNDAKRNETIEKRLQKIAVMILQGLGLNDKYKKIVAKN